MRKQILYIMLILALLINFVTVPVSAAEAVKLTVSSPSAQPGGEVNVTVSVANNTGLASLKFNVAYDSVLTLKNVTFNSAFGAYATTPTPYKNPQTLTMISPLSAVTENGVFATLTFAVAADAEYGKKAQVSITYDADDIFDGEYNAVPVTVVNGTVTVTCPHSNTTDVAEVPASCKEGGYTAGVYCNDCKTYISGHKEIGKLNTHSYGKWEKVDDNDHKHVCSVCGNPETKGHAWDAGKQTKAPTCKVEGELTKTCTDCGAIRVEPIAKLTTHSWGKWEKLNADQHKHTCTVCGTATENADHNWNSGTVTKVATCKEEGELTKTCADCGATKTEKIEKPTTHSWGKWEKLNADQHKHTCTVCGTATENADHNWNSGTVTKVATCKEEGELTKTCTDCGATKTEKIEKVTTHTWGKWTEVDANNHKRTCTVCETATETAKHGFATKYSTDKNQHWYACAACGAKKDAANHTPGAAATETAAQRCTVCSYIINPALSHTHKWDTKYTTDAESHWYACSGCNEKKDAKGHDFDNDCDGLCETCQYTRETIHKYGTEWSSDETDHFHACSVCGERKDAAAHAPGAEATETTAQTCIACGYELAPALGHTHVFDGEWQSNDANHWQLCECGEESEPEVHVQGEDEVCSVCGHRLAVPQEDNAGFPWWIIVVITVVCGAVIVVVMKKKKK